MDPIDSLLPLPPARRHILFALLEGRQHGYGLRRTIDERTSGRVTLAAGTLYESIARLLRDGLIEEAEAPEDDAAEATARWRFYGITERGRAAVRAEAERLERESAWARDALARAPGVGS